MYKLQPTSILFGESKSIIRLADGAFIPFDPANVDYQAYLKWLEEGGQPESAEE